MRNPAFLASKFCRKLGSTKKTRNISPANFHSRIKRILQRIVLGAALLLGVSPVAYAEVFIPGPASSQLDPELKGLVLI